MSAFPIRLKMLFGLIGTSATSAIVICILDVKCEKLDRSEKRRSVTNQRLKILLVDTLLLLDIAVN